MKDIEYELLSFDMELLDFGFELLDLEISLLKDIEIDLLSL